MIEIDGKWINPAHIISAKIETRYYMNGSTTYLVVVLNNGNATSVLNIEHGYGFDAYETLERIKEA